MHPTVQFGGNANVARRTTSSQSALGDSIHVLTIYPNTDDEKYDLLTFFYNIRPKIIETLKDRCEKVKHIKCYLNVHVAFTRETNDGVIDSSNPYFKSDTNTLLSQNDFRNGDLNEAYQKQFKSFDEYIARGSGWTLKHVISMELHTTQYRPTYFKTPKTLKESHAIINIKNNDNKCFMWSVLAHLHPKKKNPNRVSNYLKY